MLHYGKYKAFEMFCWFKLCDLQACVGKCVVIVMSGGCSRNFSNLTLKCYYVKIPEVNAVYRASSPKFPVPLCVFTVSEDSSAGVSKAILTVAPN